MSELMQLLTMKPHPIIGARLIGDKAFYNDDFVCCSKCHSDELTLADFYVRPSGRPSSWCKKCTTAHKVAAHRAKKQKALELSAKQAEYMKGH